MAASISHLVLCACALLAAAKGGLPANSDRAVVRRSVVQSHGATAKRSSVHAGHRAVAVIRLKRKNHKDGDTALKGEGVKGLEGANTTSNSSNFSAAFTTKLKDLHGSEFIGEIGVGTKALPNECNHGRTSLAEVTASGRAANKGSQSACRVREESSLRVVFDTGSTNIWMASDLCDGLCARKDRRRYNHTLSTTYVTPSRPTYLEIRFGTATLRGPKGVDNFHVGPFTIQKQAFNLVENEVGYSFDKLPLEGIVGLAFPSMAANGEVPFFDNVIRQGLLKHNEFAFYVGDGDEEDSGGAVLWGGVDPDLYTGEIVMFPVTQAHYWAIDLLDLRIGNESFDVSGGDDSSGAVHKDHAHNDVLLEQPPASLQHPARRAMVRKRTALDNNDNQAVDGRLPKMIVDSGTTYVTADPQLRAEIARRLPDGNCDDTAKYPHMVFTLRDVVGRLHDLDLPPREYMASADGGQTCELSLMELTIPEKYGPGMVVGELFMRRYFTVFDRGPTGKASEARIGFARARHSRTVAN